ncbi:putative reverse transcriptase domain-containing protein [Tanacetum coccineum]
MSLRTTVLGQMSEIRELHVADRRRQAMTSEMLKADHRRSTEMREISEPTLQGQKMDTKRAIKVKHGHNKTSTNKNHNHIGHYMPQLQARIDNGLSLPLWTRDAKINMNGDESILRERGTEGVVELTQWFERMETVFRISNCSVENQIKFSTCTLLAGALTWWNSHVMTVSHDVAYAMTWADLRKKMTDKMFPEESEKIKSTLLKDRLRTKGSLKTLPETIKTNNNRTRGRTLAGIILQGLVKRSHTGGSKPLCAKCNYHHNGSCAPKCHKCNKFGHFARDYRSVGNANNANNKRGTGSCQKPTCFECGAQGHFKRECPKLKNNKNHGNQVGNDRAPAKVYAVGHAGTNPDSNIMTGTFLLNNRYASILFDTGADRSFVSTAFSSQIDITPSTLDHYYDVEL